MTHNTITNKDKKEKFTFTSKAKSSSQVLHYCHLASADSKDGLHSKTADSHQKEVEKTAREVKPVAREQRVDANPPSSQIATPYHPPFPTCDVPSKSLDYHYRDQKRKILFFDSGMGGLSILQALETTFGDRFEYLYLFDNDLFPYSEKSDKVLKSKIPPLLSRIVKEEKVDLLVIACNTASTLILEQMRQELTISVVGVVPAVKLAVEKLLAQDMADKALGVVATKATIARPYTLQLVRDFAGPINYNVTFLGTTSLVEYTEAKVRGEDYSSYDLTEIFSPWLQQDLQLGAIVLACTHFSLIKTEIQELFPQVILVDACQAIARRVGKLLGIFKSQTIEAEKAEFEAYLAKIAEQPLPPVTNKKLYSTKALQDEERLVFKGLGFKDYKYFPHLSLNHKE